MKKTLIFVSVVVIAILAAVYVWLKSDYDNKWTILKSGESIGYRWLESALEGFYLTNGEFPAGVIYDENLTWETDSLYGVKYNMVGISTMLVDEFTLKGERFGQLTYYPIYNRDNGKRESFILLSAGIDGRLNNIVSDTLYKDNWWTQLDIYNLQEIMTDAFYKQALSTLYIRTKRRGGQIGGNEDECTWKYRNSIRPAFSTIQYLWGKKDYVVQYGLPYYIYTPIIDADREIEELNATWELKPQLIVRESDK